MSHCLSGAPVFRTLRGKKGFPVESDDVYTLHSNSQKNKWLLEMRDAEVRSKLTSRAEFKLSAKARTKKILNLNSHSNDLCARKPNSLARVLLLYKDK